MSAMDPRDPTPYLYDAVRAQSANAPVDALRDLQQANALNDNRAVYRSRLLLDEDLATRGVGPKSLRALSLISELIYNSPPSFRPIAPGW